jgi:hypothetical protein
MPVTPGRYTLSVSLLTLPGGNSPRLRCKPAAGYKIKTAPAASAQSGQPLFFVTVQSKKPFKVTAGQQVKRNIRTDCDPNANAIITQLPRRNVP